MTPRRTKFRYRVALAVLIVLLFVCTVALTTVVALVVYGYIGSSLLAALAVVILWVALVVLVSVWTDRQER